MAEVPQNATQLFRQIEKRITTLERRRVGAGGILDTGDCGFIGVPGGDGADFSGTDSSYPDSFNDWMDDWIADHPGSIGGVTAGANIAIEGGNEVNFEVVFSEPVSPRIGMLWFDTSA